MALAFSDIDDTRTLARAIVDTVREPLVVLDNGLRVVAASRSFYQTFQLLSTDVEGRRLSSLGEAWDRPVLRDLLGKIISEHSAIDGFEVEHDVPGIGPRVMLLNAREVFYERGPHKTILLAIEDITARRTAERERAAFLFQTEELLREKEVLIQEMQHRIANSLQLIASILLLKSRSVSSEETRQHLQDAHQRVMSVAAVQQHLHATDGIDRIEVGTYLEKLCGSLASSMIGDSRPITIKVVADQGDIESGEAVSIGLIVTELLINAIKYAFPVDKPGAQVMVTYEVEGTDWRLMVTDNGVGRQTDRKVAADSGLGTAVVRALAEQLGARIDVASTDAGMSVSIARATSAPRVSLAS